MTRLLARLAPAALGLALLAGAASAAGVDADVEAQVRQMLTEQGYDVRSVQMEDGMIEVYATKDGARLEIYLDDNLNIVETKED